MRLLPGGGGVSRGVTPGQLERNNESFLLLFPQDSSGNFSLWGGGGPGGAAVQRKATLLVFSKNPTRLLLKYSLDVVVKSLMISGAVSAELMLAS